MQKALKRTPYQGVSNIIRFNWHMYALSLLVLLLLLALSFYLPHPYSFYGYIVCVFLLLPTVVSLIVSFYIYDASKLYKFSWLPTDNPDSKILHLSAGFDETSQIIKNLHPHKEFHTMDFYHSLGKKEISIQRAQSLYPPPEDTVNIHLKEIPLPDASVNTTLAIFSAHEIRNDADRVSFFQEIHRITRDNGELYIMEHQRDLPNFLAYTLGYLHFLPNSSWRNTFQKSGWKITKTIPHTPFVSIFVLKKSHELTS